MQTRRKVLVLALALAGGLPQGATYSLAGIRGAPPGPSGGAVPQQDGPAATHVVLPPNFDWTDADDYRGTDLTNVVVSINMILHGFDSPNGWSATWGRNDLLRYRIDAENWQEEDLQELRDTINDILADRADRNIPLDQRETDKQAADEASRDNFRQVTHIYVTPRAMEEGER